MKIENINWNKSDGLIPVIIQDSLTLQVLMLGYMNESALQKTRDTSLITFYSRSRKSLWVKGETSGNFLRLVEIKSDCDNDSLLIRAKPEGPTCHLNNTSCFGEENAPGLGMLGKLAKIIDQRYLERPEKSYTSELFNQGIKRIAQKVGEEGMEVALASVCGTKDEVINETVDLIYHLLVLLRVKDVDLTEVMARL